MTQTLILPSPNDIDGTPYEVALQCIDSASQAARIARNYLVEADAMILNAVLQRALDAGDPEALDLEGLAERFYDREAPLAKATDDIVGSVDTVITKLRALGLAASYDPKHPPRES